MASDEYMDVISFRQRGDKPYAHRIGSAKMGREGKMNVYLDSLPLPDKDGRVNLVISPRQQRASGTTRGRGGSYEIGSGGSVPKDDDMEDSIPF